MFSNPTAITFVGYLLVMVCVGFYAYYHTRSYGDYILGGRSLGGFVTALSVGASDMSGWLLMGLPGAVYLAGISQSWIGIGLVLGSYINWCVVASRLRVYTEKTHNALTLPDYFSHRFEDKQNLLRIIAAVVILLFFTIYCASGVVAGAASSRTPSACPMRRPSFWAPPPRSATSSWAASSPSPGPTRFRLSSCASP